MKDDDGTPPLGAETNPNQAKPSWLPYQDRQFYRLLVERRTGRTETRGVDNRLTVNERLEKAEQNEELIIALFIDIEARRRLLHMPLTHMLGDIRLRLVRNGSRVIPDPKAKASIRRDFSEGKRHVQRWRKIDFNGRPHPMWMRYQHELEVVMEAYRTLPRARLFHLTNL